MNIILIPIYFSVVFVLSLFIYNHYRSGIRTTVITKANHNYVKYCKELDDNSILIKKGTGKNSDTTAKYYLDSKLSYWHYPLKIPLVKTLKFELFMFEGAVECFRFKNDGEKAEITTPTWTKEELIKAFDKEVIKRAGDLSESVKIPQLLWIAVIVSAVIGFLNLLVNTGRLRI